MAMMMTRDKALDYFNKIAEVSIYAVIFFIPVSNALVESFIGLAIFAWLVKKIILRSSPNEIFLSTGLNVPILIYISACTLSSLFSSNPSISLRHLFYKTAEYALLFFVIAETVDKRILKNALIVIVTSAGLLGIDGVFQYFTNWDFFRRRIPIIPSRINASFYYPNDFATYIITLLPLVASIAVLKFKKAWLKFPVMAVSLLLFICLMLSATRSVWLALVLLIPFAILLRHKKLVIFMLVLIVVSLSLFPLLSDIAKERIRNFLSFNFSDQSGYSHRKFLWQMGFDMLRERPLLGQGLGTFMYNFNKFKPADYPYNWGICYAHNCFLQIAAETGILGFVSFISIILALFFSGYKTLKRIRQDFFYYSVLSGLLIGIFTYLVDSFFDTSLYSLQLTVLFWLMLALTVAAIKIIKQKNPKEPS